jgi:hypothetical protein
MRRHRGRFRGFGRRRQQSGDGLRASPRVVAILAAYFIGPCLAHLAGHGVDVYLLDHSSTDRTVAIAEGYRDVNVIGIETLPRHEEVHDLKAILKRKEEVASSIDADWLMHSDPDEFRLPRGGDPTLREALARVDAMGYNAVNFQELTFVPTLEKPNHDHPAFQQTLRSYYPFAKAPTDQVKAWKRQEEQVNLAAGGHIVCFADRRVYPEPFYMRHYLFLSVPHLVEKYGRRRYPPEALRRGWHGWRARLAIDRVVLPSSEDLNSYTTDAEIDLSRPRTKHVTEAWVRANREETPSPRPPGR